MKNALRRRKIEHIAAQMYIKALDVDMTIEGKELTNFEYDYLLTILVQKITTDLRQFLAHDINADGED